MNISIREPKESDAENFIKTMIEDQDYHDPWINAPKSGMVQTRVTNSIIF